MMSRAQKESPDEYFYLYQQKSSSLYYGRWVRMDMIGTRSVYHKVDAPCTLWKFIRILVATFPSRSTNLSTYSVWFGRTQST